jgi:hypothetical protein
VVARPLPSCRAHPSGNARSPRRCRAHPSGNARSPRRCRARPFDCANRLKDLFRLARVAENAADHPVWRFRPARGLSRNWLRQKTISVPLTATRHTPNHLKPAKHSKINPWVRGYWCQDASKRTSMTRLDRLASGKREECRECEARSLGSAAAPPTARLPAPAPAGTIADQHDRPPEMAGTIADQHDLLPEDDSNRFCDSPQGRTRTPRPKILLRRIRLIGRIASGSPYVAQRFLRARPTWPRDPSVRGRGC